MTPEEIAALSTPLEGDEPCGPDLEMLGDTEYMRFTARIDGLLPRTFASFDRGSIDFPVEYATLKELLKRSRDLRLLTPLAKLLILNRDLAGYRAVFKLIETLLESAWPAVVPGLLDGDAVLRVVTLQTLDDMADSVMPLQAAPLFETRRFGKFAYRSHLLASGKVQARESQNEGAAGEDVPSSSSVAMALNDVDITALIASRDMLVDLQGAMGRIETLVNEKSGQDNALRFDRLPPLIKDMIGFLDQSVGQRDSALSLAGAAPAEAAADTDDAGAADAPGGPAPAISTAAQAQAALAAAATYYAQFEPSSPIVLLIGQSQALVGRSFFEAMQVLLPDRLAEARLRVGRGDPTFMLPLERLAGLSVTTARADAGPESASEENVSESQNEFAEIVEAPASPPPEPIDAAGFRAGDRRTAMNLLQQVAAYFRRAEPSSPIPLLLDRAEAIAGKDFFGLLRDSFPPGTLRIDEESSEG